MIGSSCSRATDETEDSKRYPEDRPCPDCPSERAHDNRGENGGIALHGGERHDSAYQSSCSEEGDRARPDFGRMWFVGGHIRAASSLPTLLLRVLRLLVRR